MIKNFLKKIPKNTNEFLEFFSLNPGMAEQMAPADMYRHPAPDGQTDFVKPIYKNDKTFKNYYYQRDSRRMNPIPAFYTAKDKIPVVYSETNLPPILNMRHSYVKGDTELPEETTNYPIYYVK